MNLDKLMLESAQEELDNKLRDFKGKKVSELKKILEIDSTDNKASFVKLARKMMNINGNQIELGKWSIPSVLKTVRLTGIKKPAEAMSFMPINFDDWVNTSEWKESDLYKYFSEKYLILFIFQQYPSGKRVDDSEMTFLDAKIWKMPEYDLNHGLKEIWDEVRQLIICNKLEIKKCIQKNGKIINRNNLPSSKFNNLGHLRPGGKNGLDVVKLQTGQIIAKQRFWFNVEYVKEIIDI